MHDATHDGTHDAAASSRSPLHVVGIGASAGGLEALERFFDPLPRETGMAFVVIQHLSPDFKSLMDELLARHTQIPIHLVEDGMPVEADHVYLIPPKKEMIISGGRLLLSERDRQQELTLPIDVFFRSLAQDCGARAVAVVLSGGGSDGSRGIRDVHDAGGLVLVQDLASAQFDGMPKNALDAGVAHWVLAPEAMPRVLLEHAARPLPPPTAAAVADPRGLGAVYRTLQDEFGLDFTHYKPSTITRRIERRLALAATDDIEQYVLRLRKDHDELDVLYRDLLIGVTRFFRDDEAFDKLEQHVFPELLRSGPRDAPLRVWVAGCATGEEPYSFAIALMEQMEKLGIERPVKIFATDVHRGSIERATRAVYDEEAVANVSRERLERYFLRSGNVYQVVPEVRQMVVFAQHDVIKDAPFTRVDLVSCRNLLIYLQPIAQHRVLSLFHFALAKGGVLFLGPSESAGPIANDFTHIDKHWRIYRKHSDARVPVDPRLQPAISLPVPPSPQLLSSPHHSLSQLLSTYDALLDETMPASLLLTQQGELVHVFGGASQFLSRREGRQGLDVLDAVGTELKMVLAGGLKRAIHQPSAIVFKGVHVGPADDSPPHKVTVRRVRARNGSMPHVLVAFEPMEGVAPRARSNGDAQAEIDLGQISNEQLAALEAELGHTKENLQAAIEELQASNEELQASNEELQASNEELQSTNEELQSVNEELYTVNAEYQRKIAELTELTNDMDNLLSSTDVGTIFLDRQLRIRRFTPQIAETFSLVAHDVGRPIETFAHKMDHPELVDDLKHVLQTATPVERELREARGRTHFLRILPYRAKGAVDGVVLTMIDVSGLKAAEDALFHERYLLNSLLAGVHDAIYFKDARGRFIRANQAMAERLGLSDAREAAGKTAFDVPNEQVALALHRQDEAVLRTGVAEHYKLEQREGADGGRAWDLVTRLPLKDPSDRIVGVIVVYREITEQKRAEEKIQEAVRRRDQFLAMLSHELRNPLGAIVTATGLLKAGGNASKMHTSRLLEVLERQSQQMTHLLSDLLEASRVTQNKIELKKRVIDLRSVVEEAIDAVRGQIEARGLSLSVRMDDAPLTVDGDPARLQQIHVNLLSNAAKYSHRGGHVVVEAKRVGAEAIVSVRDDGVGIPKELLASVFELFVQSNRTLDRSAGGLGVGLTLVRSLVQLHGGIVEGRSEGDGKGSEFVLRLPLTSKAPTEEARASTVRRRLARGMKVVVVEDNADSRDMLCEMLRHAGFDCRAASNGAAALALVDDMHPDIAILDLGLPEMDGFEVARRIRRSVEHAQTCLIALTGYGQANDRAATREAGFDEHLVKPVRAEQLLQLLEEMRGASPTSNA